MLLLPGTALWVKALLGGIASASTLPIGATAGLAASPGCLDTAVPVFVALAAGSLLFVVALELYSQAIVEIEVHGYAGGGPLEITSMILGAILGAWFYIAMNRWLDRVISQEQTSSQALGYGSFGERDATKAYQESDRVGPNTSSHEVSRRPYLVEFGVWLTVTVDGLPEAVLIGFLAAEDKLGVGLVVALMVANFPEGFSSAIVLRKAGVAAWRVVLLWLVVFLAMAAVACLTAFALPARMLMTSNTYELEFFWLRLLGGLIQGMAGGAMLSSIANVMLPNAFAKHGDVIGFVMLLGFLLGVTLKSLDVWMRAQELTANQKLSVGPRALRLPGPGRP